MKTTLILIRHGETAKNIEGKLHQKGDKEILTDSGKEQIRKAALLLKKLKVEKVYSSSEDRAIDSREIIQKELDIIGETVDGMEERNWGIYADRPWGDVKAILDPMTFDERYKYTPENGESWETFETRLIKAITLIKDENPNGIVAVITHGGAIRALMPYLLNVNKEESYKYDPKNASVSIFEFEDEVITPKLVDSTDHLS